MHPAPINLPALTGTTANSPAQNAFREAVQAVDNLRQQLHELRTAAAVARQRYWQQVGPVATAVVAARRALYEPLENALLISYFSRLEEQQIVAWIVANARGLEDRFGENESLVLAKYSPTTGPPDGEVAVAPPTATPPVAGRPPRRTKAERQLAAAEAAAQAALATNAKTVYRQLARAHHPDLQRDPAAQAEKTALMQQIIAAYETDDLLGLLQLLADLPTTDPASDDLLQRYAQALAQQQRTLKLEILALKYGPEGTAPLGEKRQERELRQLKRDLRDEVTYVTEIIRIMHAPSGLRELLHELGTQGI